jgi:Holliday junction resolvasome RuvABC endonuclease subunit
MIHTKARSKSKTKILDFINDCGIVHSGIMAVIEAERPEYVFIELPSGSQSIKGRDTYAMACTLIAVLRHKVRAYGGEVILATPTEVKKTITGNRYAGKQEIIDWATETYPEFRWMRARNGRILVKNEHYADGCAIAYTCALKIEER